MAEVGMTTTIPVEVILAAGQTPVDLNNIFITDPDPEALVRQAERAGYPRNTCGWIKGLYATALRMGIERVVAVTQGDCAQTHALMETLQAAGVQIIPFAYPYDRDPVLLEQQLRRFMEHFGVEWAECEEVRQQLAPTRRLIAKIDKLTWQEGNVSGAENHYWQVCCSDFNRDVATFHTEAEQFYQQAREQPGTEPAIRLGYMGVPPIITNLYEFIESLGGQVLYNEVQRQFTMIEGLEDDLLGQYRSYTYPYDVFGRIEDVSRQITRRGLDGIIHYTQTFCFREIEDMIIKQRLNCPVLTIQGERPGPLDARNKLRIEAFIETLYLHSSK